MNFVWITNRYRVNLNNIFSLENRRVENTNAITEWDNKFNELLDQYIKNGIHDEITGVDIDFDIDNITEEQINFIANYIKENNIGNQPPQYVDEYYVILSTGLTVQLPQDKFELINKHIDNLIK